MRARRIRFGSSDLVTFFRRSLCEAAQQLWTVYKRPNELFTPRNQATGSGQEELEDTVSENSKFGRVLARYLTGLTRGNRAQRTLKGDVARVCVRLQPLQSLFLGG